MTSSPKKQGESRLCAPATLAEIARFMVLGHGHDIDGNPFQTVQNKQLPITKTPRLVRARQSA